MPAEKFDQNSYKVSAGLHGVGVMVVNALSTWLKVTIWRTAGHFMEFHDGNAVSPLAVVGAPRAKRGTEVSFLPSPRTFTMLEFNFATLEHRLRELAFLIPASPSRSSITANAVEKREESALRGWRRGVREISRAQQDRHRPGPPSCSRPSATASRWKRR